ncbi:RND transporter HAE1/HME family, permease [Methylophaga lonarensis MPL]|uniref:RND transporter HAE1/HME family, permease n=2 Tax=Methylophaga lonarensis TaxID=999151 RepID=M7P1P4_9GAMM|nr:efflux RND transporter permease subunit [Methylophaga lonarensis]EMR13411.1 RND transporter HAE1/HME family, permease [Methylophaga lonarensis MPL]
MSIAGYAIDRPVNIWLLILLCLLGGLWALTSMGRLEDPAFTLKTAIITTEYPGATAQEVELEVTETLESAIQQMSQLDKITSKSMPGVSEITVEIQDRYQGAEITQIWDELRRKVGDSRHQLPDGAHAPVINDDFGDVFGIFYAVTAPGFSDRELLDLSRFLRRELLTVPGVAKVQTAAEQEETIYVDVSNEQLSSLGIPIQLILDTLQSENIVVSSGAISIDDQRIRLVSPPGFDTVTDIANLRIGMPGTTTQISLMDVATVSRERAEIPSHIIRFNGMQAFTLAIAAHTDANIVEVGQAVDKRLQQLSYRIPLGVELHPIYEQHKVVDEAINSFMVSLLLSVSIVVLVLCLAMGWRPGLVVGSTLLLTVMGTLFFMGVFDIEMERISLGALIIAMGMLVDNAIVVAEGMLINIRKGLSSRQAAVEAAARTQLPLLGATVIGIMAFAGIGLSPDSVGEFLFSLFAVIGISLLLSWVLAVTVTPLLGHYLLKKGGDAQDESSLYSGSFFRAYRWLLMSSLRYRTLTILLLLTLTGLSVVGFSQVKQAFFPASNTPLFFVSYYLPQGSDIRATSRDMAEVEQLVMDMQGVESVSSFIGRGASRFMLTYSPEQPNKAYGHLIVRTEHRSQIPPLMRQLREVLAERFPAADVYTEQLMFGPGGGAKIEARISGSDPQVLRQLAEQASEVFRQSPGVTDVRHDWRAMEPVIRPLFNEERARVAGVNREDLAVALAFATSGIQTGSYREGEEQIPVVVRPPEQERLKIERLSDRQIWSQAEQRYVPMLQVVSGFELVYEDALIHRRDRQRTITVQANPEIGLNTERVLAGLMPQLEAIELPAGYHLEWGGEYESSRDAQSSLGAQLPISFLVMLIISILLFGKLRQPLIVWLIVPMSLCGVTAALLITDMPFTFTALLGFLSLSGMLMKNAIVLVDEIDDRLKQSDEALLAIQQACVSRVRPVLLASVTTILGMLPLLWDAFFASMAVTIMGGLAFATLLSLIAAPVLYATLMRIPARR